MPPPSSKKRKEFLKELAEQVFVDLCYPSVCHFLSTFPYHPSASTHVGNARVYLQAYAGGQFSTTQTSPLSSIFRTAKAIAKL